MNEERVTQVRFRRIAEAADLEPPARATEQSSGFDLRARVEGTLTLEPGQRAQVPTGIVLELPVGFEGQIRPRSGRAREEGLTVVNAPGTVDCDYRGEIGVLLINLGREPLHIARGDRIAQLIIGRLPRVELREAQSLSDTSRGAGGFGHTGKR